MLNGQHSEHDSLDRYKITPPTVTTDPHALVWLREFCDGTFEAWQNIPTDLFSIAPMFQALAEPIVAGPFSALPTVDVPLRFRFGGSTETHCFVVYDVLRCEYGTHELCLVELKDTPCIAWKCELHGLGCSNFTLKDVGWCIRRNQFVVVSCS